MVEIKLHSEFQKLFGEREEVKGLDPKIKAEFAEFCIRMSPKDFIYIIYDIVGRLPEDERIDKLISFGLPRISLNDYAFYNWLTNED